MSKSNIKKLNVRPPSPDELIGRMRRMISDGKASFSLTADEEKIMGGELDVAQAIEIIEYGEIHGDIRQGEQAGEWLCQVVACLELRTAYAAVETVVVRHEEVQIKEARWLR